MGQDTGTQAVASGQPSTSSPAARGPRRLASALLNWLRSDLFRRTEDDPAGWRKILLAVACVAAATAVSLSRTVGAGSLNTIWIEDAKFLLDQALNDSFRTAVSAPISTYYQEPARLITALAVQFPLAWVPGIMAVCAAAQYAVYGLVAYIASGPYLRIGGGYGGASPREMSVPSAPGTVAGFATWCGRNWLRLLIAAPVCAIPLAYTQVNNDLVTVQFFGLYGAFWTVLWIPGTRAGRVLSPLVMATVSWTAVLSIVFAPLIVARLVVDRSKNAWAVAILWASGVLLQMSETILGQSHHDEYGVNGLLFVLKNYAARVVPRALFGERSLGGAGADYQGYYAPLHITNLAAHDALIACAWLVVLVAVVLAAVRLTDPNWTLAGVAALFSVGIFIDELFVNTAVVQPRYVVAPALLLYTALAALLRPRLRPRPAAPADEQRLTAPADEQQQPEQGVWPKATGLRARWQKPPSYRARKPALPRGDDPPYPPIRPSAASLRARWQKPPSYRARKPALPRGDDPPYPPIRPSAASLARTAARWVPAAGFAALLVVAVMLNFRVTNGRTTSPAWTSVVAAASKSCAVPGANAYTFMHEWWYVTIPCSKVG